ncbi:MAG: LTA synthase family protein [Clostridia bacterium]|nr:LTA synthase family protein [Clostridia bacterium]
MISVDLSRVKGVVPTIKKLYFQWDKFWTYTFFAILLKCILFLGYTLDKKSLAVDVVMAFGMTMARLPFYCGFIAVFLSFFLLLKNRRRLWALIVFNFLISVLLLIDLWYYRGFSTMPTLHLLKQTGNLENLWSTIFSLIHFVDIFLVIDIPVLIGMAFIKKNFCKNIERRWVSFICTFIVSLGIITYIPLTKDPYAIYSYFDPNITSYNLSPIGYHVLNIYSFWKDLQPYHLTDSQKEEIKTWYQEKNGNKLQDNKYKGLLKGKNLLFVQVESLEKFVINQKIDGQEITPNLNKLLKNSLYFPNIIEQNNQGNSSDADFITNTSVYPLRQGSTFFRYPYNRYNSLPKLLQKEGYFTSAIHSDKGSYWNWMIALTSIGFEKCIDVNAFDVDETIILGLSDGSYLRQLAPMILKQKQPFYTFMVTMSSHGPFSLPEKHRELKLDKELDQSKLGGYFQSVHYVDKHLGIFLDNLKKGGILDNTLVVITGDHEGVHKYYPGEIKSLSKIEDWWLENDKHIPLIVYNQAIQGEELKVYGGQVDFMPTLLYLLGVNEEKHANTAMGRNLLNTDKDFVVLKNGEVRGEKLSQKDLDHAVQGLNVADVIIKSNYFK